MHSIHPLFRSNVFSSRLAVTCFQGWPSQIRAILIPSHKSIFGICWADLEFLRLESLGLETHCYKSWPRSWSWTTESWSWSWNLRVSVLVLEPSSLGLGLGTWDHGDSEIQTLGLKWHTQTHSDTFKVLHQWRSCEFVPRGSNQRGPVRDLGGKAPPQKLTSLLRKCSEFWLPDNTII